MTRRRKLIAAAIGVIVIIAILIAAATIRRGFSTHEEPSALEIAVARAARHWAVPSELRDMNNPVPLTAKVLADGRAHFADHCATCHGNDGRGAGFGKQMYPRAPDMTLPETQQLSDGELFAVIENGVRLSGMPGFGSGTAESAAGSWALVHFIRHLPQTTPEELRAMRQLNPKSPAEWMREQTASTASPAAADTDAGDAHAATPHHH